MLGTNKFGRVLALAGFTAAAGGPAYAETLSLPGGEAKVESLATLDNPWAMAYLPDRRLLITEKPGRLRIFADGKLSEPISGVPKVDYHEQGGLLDVAVRSGLCQQSAYLSFLHGASGEAARRCQGGERSGDSANSRI